MVGNGAKRRPFALSIADRLVNFADECVVPNSIGIPEFALNAQTDRFDLADVDCLFVAKEQRIGAIEAGIFFDEFGLRHLADGVADARRIDEAQPEVDIGTAKGNVASFVHAKFFERNRQCNGRRGRRWRDGRGCAG